MGDKPHKHYNARSVESRTRDPKTGKTYVKVTWYCSCGKNMGSGGHWE